MIMGVREKCLTLFTPWLYIVVFTMPGISACRCSARAQAQQSQPVTPLSHAITLPSSPSSSSLHYLSYTGDEITDEILKHCSEFFGANYGVWGHDPTATKGPRPGLSPPFYLQSSLASMQVPGSSCLLPGCASSV